MYDVKQKLYEFQDTEYALFQSSLIPTVDLSRFIGVRVPHIRRIAKEFIHEDECSVFMNSLPHFYYEENMLHAILISYFKDFEESISCLNLFLPYVDNWAVCDTISPRSFKNNCDCLLDYIKNWIGSKEPYVCRFGLKMLMTFFLDENFMPEYLELPAKVVSDEYYVKMMIAWFFATALAKQWSSAVKYMELVTLDRWTHNKTIQKACESFRVSEDHKDYLKRLRR